jgi:hypothetical protein
MVIEPWQRADFVFGTDVLVVPVSDHNLAVRIKRRYEQEDYVVENLFDRERIFGRQPVNQLQNHLRRADLRRMDVARHQNHGLA